MDCGALSSFSAALRIDIGLVFIIAAVYKTRAGGFSLETMSALGLSAGMRRHAKHGLAVYEASLGTWLVSGVRPVLANMASVLTLAGFTVALLILKRAAVECGCFGDAPSPGLVSILRNLVLIAVTGAMVLLGTHCENAAWQEPPRTWALAFAVGAVAALSYAIIGHAQKLIAASQEYQS